MKNFITDAVDTVSTATQSVTGIYDNHIREKAIEVTDEKLASIGKSVDDIDAQDYETMVSDASKDIQSDYNKKMAQTALTLFGLDILFGV